MANKTDTRMPPRLQKLITYARDHGVEVDIRGGNGDIGSVAFRVPESTGWFSHQAWVYFSRGPGSPSWRVHCCQYGLVTTDTRRETFAGIRVWVQMMAEYIRGVNDKRKELADAPAR